MKYNGMHFPNGPHPQEVEDLPSPILLMLATEARWHYDRLRQKGKTIVWRALPRVGKRPAEIGYRNISANAQEVMNLWDAQPHYGEEWFVPYNELDLNYERGDHEDDFSNLERRYRTLSEFLINVYYQLREVLPDGTKIFFQPWTPDHGDIEYIDIWRQAASVYDAIMIHAYESPEKMLERFHWYAEQFPDKGIFIGEWNSHDPEAFLAALKTLEDHPQFLGATYFAWKWHNPANWWPQHYNVEDNPDLYNLFKGAETMPTINWPPEREPWSVQQIIERSNREADALGIPRRLLLALLYAESRLKWNSTRFAYRNPDGTYTNLTATAVAAILNRDADTLQWVINEVVARGSNDISFGVGQQTVRWADEGDHTHSIENILFIRDLYFNPDYAIRVAGKKIKYYYGLHSDHLEALCRYNKPNIPGNQNASRHNYVDGLTEADKLLQGPEPDTGETHMRVIVKRTGNSTFPFTSQPKGFILHGSRSGSATNSKSQEAAGTANWCLINPDDLSWHATIGENEYYVHMPVNRWGWNAASASDNYIAVEFAQSQRGQAITDAQVDAFVHFVKNEVLPVYPNIPFVLKTHADVEKSGETVRVYGKDDVFAYQSAQANEIKQRIMDRLKGEEPMPEHEFRFGFAAKADELGHDVVGHALEGETYISENYSLQMTEKGIMIYSKAANKVHFLKAE